MDLNSMLEASANFDRVAMSGIASYVPGPSTLSYKTRVKLSQDPLLSEQYGR